MDHEQHGKGFRSVVGHSTLFPSAYLKGVFMRLIGQRLRESFAMSATSLALVTDITKLHCYRSLGEQS
jgi:hypothetical protein